MRPGSKLFAQSQDLLQPCGPRLRLRRHQTKPHSCKDFKRFSSATLCHTPPGVHQSSMVTPIGHTSCRGPVEQARVFPGFVLELDIWMKTLGAEKLSRSMIPECAELPLRALSWRWRWPCTHHTSILLVLLLVHASKCLTGIWRLTFPLQSNASRRSRDKQYFWC
jgi:hypothetical protein